MIPEHFALRDESAPLSAQADFRADFPEIADDVVVPALVPSDRIFSSVLRVTTFFFENGTRLQMHGDRLVLSYKRPCQ